MEYQLIYVAVGLFAGFVAGLLGVGGGLIIVPALVLVFRAQGMDPAVLVHLAIGTSLTTIIVTSVSSMISHHRHGAVRWPLFWRMTPGLMVGGLLGALIARAIPAAGLRTVFGIFELLVAAQMAFQWRAHAQRKLPGAAGLSLVSGAIGAVSSVVGIGGGTMTVPLLTWCNVHLRQSVATSAACGLPIAVTGAIGFVVFGWLDGRVPDGATGYVYWPAFIVIAVASLVMAPVGAWTAHRIPVDLLRKIFALLLAVLGVRMLWPG
jgi:hypothetical protein